MFEDVYLEREASLHRLDGTMKKSENVKKEN